MFIEHTSNQFCQTQINYGWDGTSGWGVHLINAVLVLLMWMIQVFNVMNVLSALWNGSSDAVVFWNVERLIITNLIAVAYFAFPLLINRAVAAAKWEEC